jgi:uridine phosphorylase
MSNHTDSLMYHTRLTRDMLNGAKYAVIPGDPGRVESLAKALDKEAAPLSANREYTSYLANLEGQAVLVCSTGIGGPGVTILLEELATLGIRCFLRIGTSGAIQSNIKVGDLIITKAAVRLDGASLHYAPVQYPAVASFSLTQSIVQAVKAMKLSYHLGITASSDTFYPGQERYDSYSGYVIKNLRNSMEEWRQLNVLNYEMESATLLTVASALGLQAGCVCGVLVNRVDNEEIEKNALADCRSKWLELTRLTLLHHMNENT